MMKEAYEAGFQYALEKLGASFFSADQTAGRNVEKSYKVNFTRSLDNPAGLSTKGSGKLLSPVHGQPSNPKNPVASMGIP